MHNVNKRSKMQVCSLGSSFSETETCCWFTKAVNSESKFCAKVYCRKCGKFEDVANADNMDNT